MPKRPISPGNNDLATTHPHLALEWHSEKNFPRTPQNTYAKSEVRISWICSKNPKHEWESILYTRANGIGCPYCSNQRVLKGDNDLATTHPEIAKLWDKSANLELSPDQLSVGSNKIVHWVCDKDTKHTWKAPPARLKDGHGCPFCSGRVADRGTTDLATTHPELSEEWDFSRNETLTPLSVKAGSNKQVWWLCRREKHSWKAAVASRANLGRDCPYCKNQRVLAGFNDLATTNPELVSSWSDRNSPLSPGDVMAGSSTKIWWNCPEGHQYEMPLFRRLSGSKCNVCASKVIIAGVNDLATRNPTLALEWDKEANYPLKPSSVALASNKSVWWRCRENSSHTWEASPNARAKNGCPVCAGFKVVAGINDLATSHPQISSQWAEDLNQGLTPKDVTKGSNLKVWWRCPRDSRHTWSTTISNRSSRGDGCPICSNTQVLTGFNDLETKFPELAKGWDFEKNSPLLPSQVLFGSDTKVWWRCVSDPRHSWSAAISRRSAQDTGCPICTNLKIVEGINDLATIAPWLSETWHQEKNLPLKPTDIGAGTHRSVWWFCKEHPEHVWKAPVVMRFRGTGCPYCSNQSVFSGFNDLATVNPSLAADWHPTRNGSVSPSEVAPSANKKYWWRCFNDSTHEWQATPSSRSRGSNCPRCANSGYDTSRRGIFYFIENKELRASKIGITNPDRNTNRLLAWQKAGWTIISTYESDDGMLILNLETNLLRWIRRDLGFAPFLSEAEMKSIGGWSETFSYEAISHKQLIAKMHEEVLRLTNLSFDTHDS